MYKRQGSLVIRAIRDYFQPDIGEILIDTDDVFEQARQFMAHVMPGTVNRIKRYRDDVPLFSRFQIEHQIESAYSRQVILPSGGAIVIDHTEALVSVDVNSGRSTRGADIEETAFKTNLEAAEEVARQLRLRDLGGLIIIDFIDMENQRNQREVEARLRDALRFDRARVQTGKISRFGLMELSRQRLRPALAETSYIPCPRCSGTGHIRSAESAALHILRILEEEAMKDNTAAVHTQVPVDVATFLLNEKRADIQAIELRHKVRILLIPNIHLETPLHSIVRLRHDEVNQEDLQQPSYKMVDVPAEEDTKLSANSGEIKVPRQEAAIKGITPAQPAPIVAEKPKTQPEKKSSASEGGFLAKIISWFRSAPKKPLPGVEPEKPRTSNAHREGARDGRRGGRNNRRDEEREGREPRGNREPKEAREPRPPQTRDETAKQREPRETKEPREPRRQRGEPRPERKESVATTPAPATKIEIPAAAVSETAIGVAELTSEESAGARRRGRRGGRRERTERNEFTAEKQESIAVPNSPDSPDLPEMVADPEKATREPVTAEHVSLSTPALSPDINPLASEANKIEALAEILPLPDLAPMTALPANAQTKREVQPVQPDVETSISFTPTLPVAEIEAPAVMVEAAPVEIVPEPFLAINTLPNEEVVAPVALTVANPVSVTIPAPAVEFGKVLRDSGLVMVETSNDKNPSSQAGTLETVTSKEARRPRRKRPVVAPVSDEPLMMVETTPK